MQPNIEDRATYREAIAAIEAAGYDRENLTWEAEEDALTIALSIGFDPAGGRLS